VKELEIAMRCRKALIIIGDDLGVNTVKWAKELGLFTIVMDKDSDAPELKHCFWVEPRESHDLLVGRSSKSSRLVL